MISSPGYPSATVLLRHRQRFKRRSSRGHGHTQSGNPTAWNSVLRRRSLLTSKETNEISHSFSDLRPAGFLKEVYALYLYIGLILETSAEGRESSVSDKARITPDPEFR